MKKRKKPKHLERKYDNSGEYGNVKLNKRNVILPPKLIRRNFQRREK